jgi:hypothetical protein
VWVTRTDTGYRCTFELIHITPKKNRPRDEIVERERVAKGLRRAILASTPPRDVLPSTGSTCIHLRLPITQSFVASVDSLTELADVALTVKRFAYFIDSVSPDWLSFDSPLAQLAAKSPSLLLEDAKRFVSKGESEEHRRLKEYVRQHPESVGLPTGMTGTPERPLPSGDQLDVSFESESQWVAVEVKSRVSSEADVTRGLFQCVKYAAVMNAEQSLAARPRSVRALLGLVGRLPTPLTALAKSLDVKVIENLEAMMPQER